MNVYHIHNLIKIPLQLSSVKKLVIQNILLQWFLLGINSSALNNRISVKQLKMFILFTANPLNTINQPQNATESERI